MGTTSFTGPIKAGSILNTSGTTVGTDVKNSGYVVMSQAAAITQAGTATAATTGIVIPADSQIVSMLLFSTTAWNGAASTISFGTTATSDELVSAGVTSGAIGVATMSPGTSATRTGLWIDVGADDIPIYALSANTGAGVGTLVVTYIQAINA